VKKALGGKRRVFGNANWRLEHLQLSVDPKLKRVQIVQYIHRRVKFLAILGRLVRMNISLSVLVKGSRVLSLKDHKRGILGTVHHSRVLKNIMPLHMV